MKTQVICLGAMCFPPHLQKKKKKKENLLIKFATFVLKHVNPEYKLKSVQYYPPLSSLFPTVV